MCYQANTHMYLTYVCMCTHTMPPYFSEVLEFALDTKTFEENTFHFVLPSSVFQKWITESLE